MTYAIEYLKSKKLLVVLLAALVSFQLPITWLVCSYFFPGYNSIAQSLSELCADDSPVKWVVRSSLIFQAALISVLSLTLASTARTGKILLRLAALFMVLAALVPSPSQTDYSLAHRVASFLAFAFGCLWPAFATGKGEKGTVSRKTGILVSLSFLAFTLIGWSFWAFATQTYFGILQRINILGQSLFIGWYWWRSFRKQD
ncbi:MAG: DUF998 domain-containing protein [Rhodoluna sp.]|nr:DUF998 domain-containing protein [Rhodoluna sp.]